MSSHYKIAITRDYWRKLHSLERVAFNKWQRVGETFFEDPFHPSLDTELLRVPQEGVYSARLDVNYRIIFRHIKPDHILLFWVDKHDAAYSKARRTSVSIEAGVVRVVETVQTEVQLTSHPQPHHQTHVGKLFEPWTDKELLNLGLPAGWLPTVRLC